MAVTRPAPGIGNSAFPSITTPLETTPPGAPPSGGPSAPWYQFLRALWVRTGSQQGIDGPALTASVADNTLELAAIPPDFGDGAPPPFGIAVGASPFSFQAPFRGTVLISGGTVSALQWTRDGSTFFTYPTGVVEVFTGDVVKVTYSGLPTMTMIGSGL